MNLSRQLNYGNNIKDPVLSLVESAQINGPLTLKTVVFSLTPSFTMFEFT